MPAVVYFTTSPVKKTEGPRKIASPTFVTCAVLNVVANGARALYTTSTLTRKLASPIPPMSARRSRMFVRTSEILPSEPGPSRAFVDLRLPPELWITVVPIGLSIVPLMKTSPVPPFSTSTSVGPEVWAIVNVSETDPAWRSTSGVAVLKTEMLLSQRFLDDRFVISTFCSVSLNVHVPPLPQMPLVPSQALPLVWKSTCAPIALPMSLTKIVAPGTKPEVWCVLPPAALESTLTPTACWMTPAASTSSLNTAPRMLTSELKSIFWPPPTAGVSEPLSPPVASERLLESPWRCVLTGPLRVSMKSASSSYPAGCSRSGSLGSRGPAVIVACDAPKTVVFSVVLLFASLET